MAIPVLLVLTRATMARATMAGAEAHRFGPDDRVGAADSANHALAALVSKRRDGSVVDRARLHRALSP